MSSAERIAARLRAEHGFTMIELIVAMVICLVGITSTLVVLDTSRQMTTVSQKREAAVAQAERELERAISRPWAEIAHPPTATPARSLLPGHPSRHVTADNLRFRWNQTSNAPAATSNLQIEAAGTIDGRGTDWQDVGGRARGQVFRYVTVAGTHARRVTVAVTVAGPDAPKRYILVNAVLTNPNPL